MAAAVTDKGADCNPILQISLYQELLAAYVDFKNRALPHIFAVRSLNIAYDTSA